MGIPGFYIWLKKNIGYVPKTVYVKKTDTLLFDAKLYMYRYQFAIAYGSQDIEQDIANAIIQSLSQYNVHNITFCNDGSDKISKLKSNTLIKREMGRTQIKKHAEVLEEEIKQEKIQLYLNNENISSIDNNNNIDNNIDNNFNNITTTTTNIDDKNKKRQRDDANDDEKDDISQKHQKLNDEMSNDNKKTNARILTLIEKEAKLERLKRESRGLSTNSSKKILDILQKHGFKCIQCDGEADEDLARLANQYTYVVSEDSDLLIKNVKNLLRGFGKTNQIYNIDDIISKTNITLKQLRYIACLSGCDYTDGIKNIGLNRAYQLIKEHKHINTLLDKCSKQYHIPPDFKELVTQIMNLFETNNNAIQVNELTSEIYTTNNVQPPILLLETTM